MSFDGAAPGSVIRASLVLAAGVLLSTLAAVRLADVGWALMTAPVVMALALMWAGDLIRRAPSGRPTAARTAIVLSIAVLTASAIVVATDPHNLAMIMPVLGAATGGGLVAVTVRAKRR